MSSLYSQWRVRLSCALCLLSAGACSGSARTDGAAGGAGVGGAAGAGAAGTSPSGAGSGAATSTPCLYQACPDAGPRPTPLPRPKCPSTEPQAGEACSEETLYCGYGDSPAINCRSAYTCTKGDAGTTWVLDPALTKVFPCIPASHCSAAVPALGAACDGADLGLACQYPGLVCHCQYSSHEKPTWTCLGAPQDQACPEALPNIGEGCTPNGIECDYTVDACDPTPDRALFCYEGAWEPGQDLGCAL